MHYLSAQCSAIHLVFASPRGKIHLIMLQVLMLEHHSARLNLSSCLLLFLTSLLSHAAFLSLNIQPNQNVSFNKGWHETVSGTFCLLFRRWISQLIHPQYWNILIWGSCSLTSRFCTRSTYSRFFVTPLENSTHIMLLNIHWMMPWQL